MKLAVVGSVSFAHPYGMSIAADLIDDAIRRYQPTHIVSGGAPGIDSLAAKRGHAHGLEVVEYLPDNPRWEPDGYKARNLLIAENCDRLLRIFCTKSKTYGSGWTADQAERIGKPVDRQPIAPVEVAS